MTSRTLLALGLTLAATGVFGSRPALAQTPPANESTTTTTTTAAGDTTTVETTTVQALPPAPAPAAEETPRLDERTAFMGGKHRLKLGILAFEYGILQRLSVGSDPPAWAARAVVKVWVPNAHLKVQIVDRDPVWVALLGAVYYARIDSGDSTSGHLIDTPLSVFTTVKVHPRVFLHGEAAYLFARVVGSGDLTKTEFKGVAPLRAGQVGLMAQFQLTRIVSLTATGRYQFYAAN